MAGYPLESTEITRSNYYAKDNNSKQADETIFYGVNHSPTYFGSGDQLDFSKLQSTTEIGAALNPLLAPFGPGTTLRSADDRDQVSRVPRQRSQRNRQTTGAGPIELHYRVLRDFSLLFQNQSKHYFFVKIETTTTTTTRQQQQQRRSASGGRQGVDAFANKVSRVRAGLIQRSNEAAQAAQARDGKVRGTDAQTPEEIMNDFEPDPHAEKSIDSAIGIVKKQFGGVPGLPNQHGFWLQGLAMDDSSRDILVTLAYVRWMKLYYFGGRITPTKEQVEGLEMMKRDALERFEGPLASIVVGHIKRVSRS